VVVMVVGGGVGDGDDGGNDGDGVGGDTNKLYAYSSFRIF
jgi:hypothetical protein